MVRQLQKVRRRAQEREDEFWGIGIEIMNCENSRASDKTLLRRFLSFFGAEPLHVSIIWLLLEQSGWLRFGEKVQECHLLWALMFLKVYSTETVHARMVVCDEKTFRAKVWFLLEGIATLDIMLVSKKMNFVLYFYYSTLTDC